MYRAMQTTFPVADALGMQPEIWVDVHENGGVYLDEAGKITGFPGRTRAQIAQEFPNYVIPTVSPNPAGGTRRRAWKAFRRAVAARSRSRRNLSGARRIRRRRANGSPSSRTAPSRTRRSIRLLNQLPNRSVYYLHYNTAITRIDFEKDHMIVRYLNRVDHLSPDLIS
ncbi:MAG: hypothetical protein IPK17_38180 [Chloroflexi bacterium]|uniref:hypothetical protein n=1 Tax=Candidatus Flexifilum breve TaxID=3140694 RepID=UPI003136BF02|nr:hypothetical protein [Chloroflexota bacterium]